MKGDRGLLWLAVGVVAALLGGLFFWQAASEAFKPSPLRAWVAIQLSTEEFAAVGPKEIAADTPFLLHAVLEAKGHDGEKIYYTEAERLRIEDQEVPQERLRRWNLSGEARVLWFTVEGAKPYVEIVAEETDETDGTIADQLEFREVYQADWGQAWTIPGRVRSRQRAIQTGWDLVPELEFGSQFYHVRVEVYAGRNQLTPQARYVSWGAGDIVEQSKMFPKVVALLPGALGEAGRVVGLSQLEAPSRDPDILSRIVDWSRRGLGFSRSYVVHQVLSRGGSSYDGVNWQSIETVGDQVWGESGVQPGDLMRAGNRIVVAFQDRGEKGVLDPADLCFDYHRGATVRPLGEVFSGDGLVEWGQTTASYN